MKRANKNLSFDLTAFAESESEANRYPTETLHLIDRAIDAAKEAAHACHDKQARECFEFALALLRESWIAESGQTPRGAEKVIADVKWGLRLIASVFSKEEGR